METTVARTLFLIVFLWLGFRKAMAERAGDRPFSEWLVLLACAELALFSIISPARPFTYYLIPMLLLLGIYHLFRLLQHFPPHFQPASGLMPLQAQNFKAGDPIIPVRDETPMPEMALALIEGGKIRADNLRKIGRTQLWLRQELRKFGYRDIRQVNYLTMDSTGNFFMDLKKDKNDR
ncbi:MAG: YetF domain-containing protein [Sporolactobacillus sp.]